MPKRVITTITAGSALLLLSACGGVAAQGGGSDAVEMRITTMLPPDGASSDLIEWFADEIETRTDGKVQPSVTYSGALLSGADTLTGLAQGRAEAGLIAPAYFPADLPLNNVMMVPVTVSDREAHARALDDLAQDVPEVSAEFEDSGVVPIGYFPTATMTITYDKKLSSLADLQGAKLRIPSQPQAAVWEELGVEPVFLASEEVYEAVERGIINGVAYPLDTQVANGITEVAKTIVPDVGASGGSVFTMSKTTFDALPDDVASVVEELQGEWYDKGIEILVDYERQACEDFKAEDGTVLMWDDRDQATIEDAIASSSPEDVWKKDAAGAGADQGAIDQVWEQFNESLATYAAESTYPGLAECASS
ncbi:TRAP-type C4-dicarboxylate transport system substrate-binding protein [Nocardioides cavernae]|uniref:TRAP-type C4-dicarboxylate transport system substrate-binding protein n=1 Tax=Nocardioides cavernae TaxID=1921566 RepID=A0A7Y9H0N4_9ACTN|nr:TRAP transporter substrate-binding protein DctP [Nocardioides cavernae]NYE35811.1 TRAP-type C4-dicarboxylate transport system substrate-binding protein [Nocardioides cavernae]